MTCTPRASSRRVTRSGRGPSGSTCSSLRQKRARRSKRTSPVDAVVGPGTWGAQLAGLPCAERPLLKGSARSPRPASSRSLNQSAMTAATSTGSSSDGSRRSWDAPVSRMLGRREEGGSGSGQEDVVGGVGLAAGGRILAHGPAGLEIGRLAIQRQRAPAQGAARAEGLVDLAVVLQARRARGRECVVGGLCRPAQERVRRHAEGVGEALQFFGAHATPARLDATHRGLIEAHGLGKGALAPALLFTQSGQQRTDRLLMLIAHRVPSPCLGILCTSVRHAGKGCPSLCERQSA